MHKKWRYSESPPPKTVDGLASLLNTSPIASTLLLQRGIVDFDEAKIFFRPSLSGLHDPMLMKGMDCAVARLCNAIEKKELICVYGDYDVDGTTSVAMIYQVLEHLGARVCFYIPDRHTEGYGLSSKGVDYAVEQGVGLLLCIDCGTKAVAMITKAKAQGIDVIVCDHHEPGKVLPPTVAMLNPKQKDCTYPFKELSACGIGFKLLQALVIHGQLDHAMLLRCLDLVVVSIAADIVPLVGENRLLAFHGLQRLNTSPRPGLAALISLIKRPNPLCISDIVFGFAPRINAAGRIEHAKAAVSLLLADQMPEAHKWAKYLHTQNDLRREIDSYTMEEALAMIRNDKAYATKYTTVLYKKDWHKGILGIVASRCIEHHYRPTVLFTEHDGKATGSARSVMGYNLYNAIQVCAPLLTSYGGHAYAAGLTLPCENIEAFKQKFEQAVASTINEDQRMPFQHIDLCIQLAQLTPALCKVVEQMGPFGPDNHRPVFSTKPVIARKHWIYQEKHLKLHVQQIGTKQVWEAIGFGMAPYLDYIKNKQPFAVAYTVAKNNFQGKVRWQIILKDLQPLAT